VVVVVVDEEREEGGSVSVLSSMVHVPNATRERESVARRVDALTITHPTLSHNSHLVVVLVPPLLHRFQAKQ